MKSLQATLLVVDDEDDDVFFIERAIRETGTDMKVQIARSGEDAINYLEGKGAFSDREVYPLPSLVFLDLKMPRIDGFDILRWKSQRSNLKMPFVILSSSPDDKDVRLAHELGASWFMVKPPTKPVLLSCFKQFGLEGVPGANHSPGTET